MKIWGNQRLSMSQKSKNFVKMILIFTVVLVIYGVFISWKAKTSYESSGSTSWIDGSGYVYTNARVGIGTSNPNAEFHLVGDIFLTAWDPDIIFASSGTDGNTQIRQWADWGAGLSFYSGTDQGTRMRLNFYAGSIANAIRGLTINHDGTAICDVLSIVGGSDIAERFDIYEKDVKPGMVVVIDPDNAGKLKISEKAYDRGVAGIISGAAGIEPGMVIGKESSADVSEYPVALSGRAYVLADATPGSIKPGDLLTTSDTPGHAMKVINYDNAQGAIIGKAMESLRTGKGLVLVLVTLQ